MILFKKISIRGEKIKTECFIILQIDSQLYKFDSILVFLSHPPVL